MAEDEKLSLSEIEEFWEEWQEFQGDFMAYVRLRTAQIKLCTEALK